MKSMNNKMREDHRFSVIFDSENENEDLDEFEPQSEERAEEQDKTKAMGKSIRM